jgi:hypothetical protein
MIIEEYQRYNTSFRKTFIYRLGGSTGFFSEYNNMILAMHYCLVNQIRFTLESSGANFSSGLGWEEFFWPFCEEKNDKWISKFNYRKKPVYKSYYEKIGFNLYKKLHPNYIFTYSLFETVRNVDVNKVYCVKELGLNGTLLQNCSAIHNMIWKYNSDVAIEISGLIKALGLPQRYVGIHIRQGDKTEETELYLPDAYMAKVKEFSGLKDAFVLTDDYRVIDYLRDTYKDYRFFTLCQTYEKGYSFPKLRRLPQVEQRLSYLRLWASMDIMAKADLFVGTYSANPGMNMGFRMDPATIKCVDFNEWQLW